MTNRELEYMLEVWEKKPNEPLQFLSNRHWRAHVTNAYAIPRIGELIFSEDGLELDAKYRVFDVRHDISPRLSSLIVQGREEVKKVVVPEGERGLVHVLAYLEK